MESFGITWKFTGGKPGGKQKNKKAKDCQELFNDQYEKIEEMLKIGSNHKDINTRIHKLKRIMEWNGILTLRC